MSEILVDVWHHIKSLKPGFISRTPHFNFITVHYFWIIGISLLGSICLFPNGKIKYIDALFLCTGAATQSGLNTVDINLLDSWQQIVLYIISMMSNPITVNSFVVFLRLYWFEKRFQHIAKEAKKGRRSIARSFSRAKSSERDIGREEQGVNGRSIVVMHNSGPSSMKTEGAIISSPEYYDAANKAKAIETDEKPRSGSSNESEASHEQSSDSAASGGAHITNKQHLDEHHRPQIKFGDQVKRSNGMADEDLRIPAQRSTEEHIAFLERQRQQDGGDILRIPGPRDADAGVAPEAVDESDPTTRTISRRESGLTHASDPVERLNGDDHPDTIPQRRNITIAEPVRPQTAEHVAEDVIAAKNTLGALRLRTPRFLGGKKKLSKDENHPNQAKSRTSTFQSVRTALTKDKYDGMPYLSWEATVGRNSAFVDLTEAQREELGGIEYRSLKSLALILTLYFWGFSIFGVVCLLPWIIESQTYGKVVTSVGQGRVWWALFTANSSFTDLGFTLTPDSMISFNTAIWPLLLMSFLIIIGNTGFPIMLRIIIWLTSKYVPKESGIWEELKFLLDHPRRCFTLLFPSKATWWLFWILVILNGLDLVLFIVLDLGNSIVTQLPINVRILDGWFQAVSTRTAGLAVVNLAELHPAIQVSYLIMMYISVLPIAISVRRTNVYEEKSLGIYGSPSEENQDEGEPSYVGAHLRRQLSFDLWYIFLGAFIIAISEGSRIQSGDPAFTMFSVLFEIVSAYGTVGLSLGYTGINASLSAEFGVIAKLVIISMQIRGRHRGLPYELDRAILLPSEHLQQKEAADAAERARRHSSSGQYGIGPIGSGPNKSMEKTTSRGTTRDGQNFLSSMLHPGPTMPSSHRNQGRQEPTTKTEQRRRHSISVAGMRAGSVGRSLSPKASQWGNVFGDRDAAGTEAPRGRGRVEGRRSFFQEGVNPPLQPLHMEGMREEGKQA